MKRILLVEDDQSLAKWISDYLSDKNYLVDTVVRGDDALKYIEKSPPDLVLLDGILPGLDGFEVCKKAREFYFDPIIMLTARDDEVDEILGLEYGANDYITKPVRARVLLARMKVLLRQQPAKIKTALTFNKLHIDQQARTVKLGSEAINISSNEFDLLWVLASNAGHLTTRTTLLSELRGLEYDGSNRSIDLCVSRLRKKLSDNSDEPFKIKTVWSKGYLFVPTAW